MGSFFKSFGKGILYLFVLPFLLIILALYGIAGLFGFIFLFFKSIILFFTGRSLNDDLPEDVEAKRRLYGEPVEEQESVPQQEEQKPEEFSVYHPDVDPFSVRSANEDPYKAPTVKEGLWGREEPQPEPMENPIDESVEDVQEENIGQIASSLNDLVEEPKMETIPTIEEPQIDESEYQQISTSDIDDSNKYTPRGSEELMSIDDDDPLEDDDDAGISFDNM